MGSGVTTTPIANASQVCKRSVNGIPDSSNARSQRLEINEGKDQLESTHTLGQSNKDTQFNVK